MSEPRSAPRAVVIGCGPIGRMHAEAIRLCPDAELVGVCDVDQTRADAAGKQFAVDSWTDFTQMFEATTPAIATIATPNHLHVEPCLEALNRGCDVFCEKPLSIELSSARQLAALADQRGAQLAVDYNRRFGFGYQRAKQWIDEGRIGALSQLTLHIADRIPPPHVVATGPTVMLSSLLLHHIDLVRLFAGEVTRVWAHARERTPELIAHMHLSLETDGGAIASISSIYRDGQSRTRETAILDGDLGEIRVEDVSRAATLTRADADEAQVVRPPQFHQGDRFYQSVTDHLLEFLRCVANQEPIPVAAREGLVGMEIADAVRASLDSGKAVDLDDSAL